MTYQLKLEKFTGPLEKLLELIEEKKLDVTEISLAQVTDDFLIYFRSLTNADETQKNAEEVSVSQREVGVSLRIMADFISIASRLVLIKSKFLLPDLTLTPDEEAGIKDLERRLKIYQELKPVLKFLAKLWRSKEKEFGRAYFLSKSYIADSGGPLIFYPGGGLEIVALLEAVKKLFDTLRVEELETETIKEKIISLEEKIKEVIERLEHEIETNFSNLSNKKSRSEIVIIFLAILHLAREQLVSLEQSGHFSDIMITKKDANMQM